MVYQVTSSCKNNLASHEAGLTTFQHFWTGGGITVSPSYNVDFHIPQWFFFSLKFLLDSHVQSPHFCPVCAGGVVLRSTLKTTADIMVTIPEYYAGKNVLITGATGFMGKVQL